MGYADKILAAATTTAPDGSSQVDDKYLAQLVTSADKNITDLEQDANDQLAKQRMAAMKLRIDLDASIRTMVAKLHNTAGQERGKIIAAAQQDMANIRDNYIKLVSENPAVIGSVTTKAEQAVVNAGDTPQARVDGWDILMGDMNDLGVVSVGNPEVLAVYRWAEKRLGDPEDPSFPDGEIRRRALEFKRIAMDAETQKTLASRKDLDGQLGQLTASISNLAGQADLQKAIGETVSQLQQLGQNAATLYPPSVANQAAELQLFLSNSKGYNDMVATRNRAIAAMFGSPNKAGMSDMEKLARLAANPHFSQWAKSNGYNIGTIQFNADGTPDISSYVPTRDAVRAAYTYDWQRDHKPEQLIRDYDSGRWVELTVRKSAEAAVINGSRFETLLQPQVTKEALAPDEASQTPGRDSAAQPTGTQKAGDAAKKQQSNLYAYTTDDTGDRVYLNAEQLDAISLATLKTDEDPIAFVHNSLPYIYDPRSQTLYEGALKNPKDPSSGVWRKSSKKLEDVGQSANNYEGQLAVVKRGDQYATAPSDGIEGQAVLNVLPAGAVDTSNGEPEGSLASRIDGAKLKTKLSDAGVVVTTEPPPSPEFKTYGKEIRMHATDPVGSIRIRDGAGEHLYTKDQVARVETTLERSPTTLPIAVSSLIGRRDQRLAQKLRDSDPVRRRWNAMEQARWTGYPAELREQPDVDRMNLARPQLTEAAYETQPDLAIQNPLPAPTTFDPQAVLSPNSMGQPPVSPASGLVQRAEGNIPVPKVNDPVSGGAAREARRERVVLPDAEIRLSDVPVLGPYDTPLTADEEIAFQKWKAKYAPRDSGEDYDLRGAFKAGLTPDAETGHWPDTYKKPNHPTFSVESRYAVGPDLAKAGRWEGERFIPAGQPGGQSAAPPPAFKPATVANAPDVGAVPLSRQSQRPVEKPAEKPRQPVDKSAENSKEVELKPSTPVFEPVEKSAEKPMEKSGAASSSASGTASGGINLKPSTPVFDSTEPSVDASTVAADAPPTMTTKRDLELGAKKKPEVGKLKPEAGKPEVKAADDENPERLSSSSKPRRAFRRMLGY